MKKIICTILLFLFSITVFAEVTLSVNGKNSVVIQITSDSNFSDCKYKRKEVLEILKERNKFVISSKYCTWNKKDSTWNANIEYVKY